MATTRRISRTTAGPALLAALVTVAVALSGCGGAPDNGSQGAVDKGYVSGDGSVTLTSAGDRQKPVELRGTTLEDEQFDLADHRGSVVVVNVWGSWCPPCIAEAPALQKAWEQTKGDGVQFVGVDTRDQPAAARAHQRRFGVTYPSIDDQGGRALLAFRGTLSPSAIPSTLVLDRRGRVAARVIGEVNATTLRGIVDDVAGESRAQGIP